MIVSCSACQKPLLCIEHRDEPLPGPVAVVVKCPYCGDRSFPSAVDTRYGLSGYVVEDDSLPDGYREVTDVASVKEVDGVVVVKVIQSV